MFDRIRQQLQRRIGAKQQVLAQALATRDAAQARLDGAQAALGSAQSGLEHAQAVLAQAHAAAATAAADREAAQAARDAAEEALTLWRDGEPENPLPNGKPNPAWRTWVRRLHELELDVDRKQQALANATNALVAANATRDAAAAQVVTAEGGVAGARAVVAAANDQLAATLTAVTAAQAELVTVSALPAQLDERAARILAEPLDVEDLEQASDRELSEALARQHDRHDLLVHRLETMHGRGATLAGHDATADDLATLAGTIRSWPGTGSDPELNAVAAALDGVAAESRAQRTTPAPWRTDDLAAVAAVLAAQAARIGNLLAAATAERDAAGVALQGDADTLATINAKAPKR